MGFLKFLKIDKPERKRKNKKNDKTKESNDRYILFDSKIRENNYYKSKLKK